MTFLWKDQLKIITCPLFFSILDGLFLFCCLWGLSWEHMQLAGKVPQLGSVISWHEECSRGNRLSQPLSCDTAEGQRGPSQMGKHGHISLLFSWGAGYIQSKYFVISNEKGWVNINVLNINKCNGKGNIDQPCYFCTNVFLVSCFTSCDVLAMCGAPYGETFSLYWSVLTSNVWKSVAGKGTSRMGLESETAG